MAKYEQRLQTRLMRMEGISIIVIAKTLNVSKSSISAWCRDILLSSEQIEKLKKQKGSVMGRWMGAESNRKKKRDAIKNANDWGNQRIKKVSQKGLLLKSLQHYIGAKDQKVIVLQVLYL